MSDQPSFITHAFVLLVVSQCNSHILIIASAAWAVVPVRVWAEALPAAASAAQAVCRSDVPVVACHAEDGRGAA